MAITERLPGRSANALEARYCILSQVDPTLPPPPRPDRLDGKVPVIERTPVEPVTFKDVIDKLKEMGHAVRIIDHNGQRRYEIDGKRAGVPELFELAGAVRPR